ncbi:HNH endonuclease [Bacillus wiedmannii]|uniref:HNH endonuclease n=1 Tax=Bacillus wiedmannii TaxID=1890302 RepID=UPI0032FB53D1|nr:HNH endonuclease [Bacillus cereus]
MAKEYAKKFCMCEPCKGEPGYIVDHIVEITPENINNSDITLNHDNLQYLCLPCHNTKMLGKSVLIREVVMFDENNDLIRRGGTN